MRGGAESTSKIPRHLFTHGGDTGRKKAGSPHPAGSARSSRGKGGTPVPTSLPTNLSQAPYPQLSKLACRAGRRGRQAWDQTGGGIQELLSSWRVPRRGESGPRGGLSRGEILKRGRHVCQNRSPRAPTDTPPPPHTHTRIWRLPFLKTHITGLLHTQSITYSFKQFYRYLVCAGAGLDTRDIPSYPPEAVSTFRYSSAQAHVLL